MNLAFAWISTVCVFFLCVTFPVRILLKNKFSKSFFLKSVNSFLRKIHKPLGIVTIIIVFIHCRISFESTGLRSFIGVVLLLLLLIITFSYFIRKIISGVWLKVHQALSLILVLISIYHIFLEF